MVKILITGGAGFIGSHIAEILSKSNLHEIIVMDNLSTGNFNTSLLKSLSVSIIKKNIESKDTWLELPKDIDVIIHLAAMNRAPKSIKDPVKSNEINITGTLNILEYARKENIRVCFSSSSSVFGQLDIHPRPEDSFELAPSHPYGLGKLTSEHYCRLYNELYDLDTRIVRYFSVYGPRQSPNLTYSAVIPNFIKSFIYNKPITIHGGKQTRNFTFVKDTAEATKIIALAKKVKKRIYQVGGTTEISIEGIVKLLEDITNKKMTKEYIGYQQGDIMRSVPLMNNLSQEFNFSPKTDLTVGLKQTYEWFLNNPNYFEEKV